MQQLRKILLILPAALFITAPHVHGMYYIQAIYNWIQGKNEELFQAVEKGNIEHARKLIENGANVETHDSGGLGFRPLHRAAQNGYIAIAQLLIENGANLDAHCIGKQTPLHIAARRGQTKAVRLLINGGAHINAQSGSKETPLHDAAFWGRPEVAQILIHNGADVNTKDYVNNTPYQRARSRGYRDIATLCDRISSLQNNDINAVITDETSREDTIYYTQAMIAYGYCDIAQQIIDQKLPSLSDDEYADIMVHAIQHRNNQTVCNQFITDNNALIGHLRNTYENKYNNKAQTVVNKVWNHVQDNYVLINVIAWVLRNYETQCGAFCDGGGNTIAHLSTSARFNQLLPHIMTVVMQNENNNSRNNNNKTPVMLHREIGNNEGADIIHKVVRMQNIFSPDERHRSPSLNHFIRQLDEEKSYNTNQIDSFAVELKAKVIEKYKAQAERTRSTKKLPPEITDQIIAWISGKQMLDTNASQHD